MALPDVVRSRMAWSPLRTLPASRTAHGHADAPSVRLEADSNEAWMLAFVQGDASSFERLYERLAPKLLAALKHMSGDARLAEDLTQMTFMNMVRARATYQPGMAVSPWLFAIARNLWLDHRRTLGRRPESLSRDGGLPDGCAEPCSMAHVDLIALLGRLPRRQRDALLLIKVRGLTVVEAAALCGTSPASMKMRMQRAYRSLRAALAREVQP